MELAQAKEAADATRKALVEDQRRSHQAIEERGTAAREAKIAGQHLDAELQHANTRVQQSQVCAVLFPGC